MSVQKHKEQAPNNVNIGVIAVSTTRSINTDQSGHWIVKTAKTKGHKIIVHKVLKDDKYEIRKEITKLVKKNIIDIIIITGGTGIANKDVTIEALNPLFLKQLPNFASIFAQLSYKEIGSAAILSRACAGIIEKTTIFCLPGSKKACILACNTLIFPELGHILSHIISI